jgi:dihydroorotase
MDLARRHQHRFHVLHVSTAEECDLLVDSGPWITAEACPHHLFFSEQDYDRLGSLIQANPSVKTPADCQRIWQALLGGEIQVIATDHAPHTLEEKRLPYPQSPSGIPCVENSLALMLNQVNLGHCSIEQVVRWMSEAPAQVWDIVGKGRIEIGYDADVVLVDMQRPFPIRNEDQLTKCGWSPWHGETLLGAPVRTWVGGQLAFADERVNDDCRGREAIFDHARGGYWSR